MSWLIFSTWLVWFAEFNQTSAQSFSLGLGFTAPIASNMHSAGLFLGQLGAPFDSKYFIIVCESFPRPTPF